MLNFSRQSFGCIALAIFAAMPLCTYASPRHVEQFDGQTWQQFQTSMPKPSVVVFTTTDCSHCPAVIKKMTLEIKQHKIKATLIVVVMDGEGNQGLVRDPHYLGADRLFAFSGQTAALRYSVNPKWLGITPYVVLFAKAGEPQFITGSPSEKELRAWRAVGSK